MIGFQSNPFVLVVIMSLILVGGLGFIVWRDILTYHKNKKLLLHTRVVLIATATIMLMSFIFICFYKKMGIYLSGFVNTLFLVVTLQAMRMLIIELFHWQVFI